MYKVLIRECDSYDKDKLIEIFHEGIEKFGIKEKIAGKIVIKPNVVLAHPSVAPAAFTKPEFIDALITSIENLKNEIISFVIIENSGAGIPTSRMFRRANYIALRKNHKNLRFSPFEESKKIKIKLNKGKIHREITVQKDLLERDFLIYAPKLKTNVLSHGLTSAIKLNIGILGDKERMKDHTYKLPVKMIDLLEVGYPDFIATDAIEIAMGGNQMTEHPLHLGAVIMSNHPLSHDVVCAHILNLDPLKIPYLLEAKERGYGTLNINEIEIDTNISLKELKKRTLVRDTGFKRVESVGGPFKIYSGDPYCYGGCHGVMLDWLYMLKDRANSIFERKRDVAVVIGEFRGDVEAKKIILLGTCSKVIGNLKAKRVLRIKGCPTRHKDLILHFFLKTGVRAPLLRPSLLLDAYPFLFWSHLKGFLSNLL